MEILVITIVILFIALVFFIIPQNKLCIPLLFLVTIFSAIPFYLLPPIDWDLYRHYQEIDTFRIYGLSMAMEGVVDKPLFIKNLIFYLVSLSEHNALLPFISIFINYFVPFFISIKLSERYHIKSKYLIIVMIVQFFSIPFLSVISGVRSILSITIFVFFLYRELLDNKSRWTSWIIYFLLIYIHPIILLFVLLRIIIEIHRRKFINFLLCIWFIPVLYIINHLKVEEDGIFIFYLIYKLKFYGYSIEESEILEYIYYSGKMVFLLLACFVSKIDRWENKFTLFVKTYSCFLVGGCVFYFMHGSHILLERGLQAMPCILPYILLPGLGKMNSKIKKISLCFLVMLHVFCSWYWEMIVLNKVLYDSDMWIF